MDYGPRSQHDSALTLLGDIDANPPALIVLDSLQMVGQRFFFYWIVRPLPS
jgi:hypothetical protein